MKSATQCLNALEIQALLSGTASHVESKTWEDHVSACEHCRAALAGSIGDEDWWHEAEQSLMGLPKPESQESIDNEGETIDELLKLLGPTDDPRMLGRIGLYEVLGVLGRGGMGVVFKAFDASLNRFVAIKMLLPHLAASGAARKRFAREAQAIAAVVDDHVMAIHCVDEWQGVPYLVMTYSRGVSLQKRLTDQGPLEVREILRIGMQAAKGLAAAHSQGIVHRDIKPANIFLDQNVERVQLMDFGLARAVDDASLTRSGTLAGTPQYMSPEQARGETVDHRSDLFSLGSVLYAMCTGHSPFRSESSYSVLRLITDKEPRPIREVNSEIPNWLCAIIGKLMSKSPEDRFASAIELAEIFEQCLAHVQDPIQHLLPLAPEEFRGQTNSKGRVKAKLNGWFLIMNDKQVVSLISLVLFLMALLVPWPIATIGSLESALAFAGVATALSLGLALLSRSEYFSRIVLWSVGVPMVLAVVGFGISVPIFMLRDSNVKDTQQVPGTPLRSNVSEEILPSKNSVNAVKPSNATSDFRIAGKCVDENGNLLENVTVELYRNAEATTSLKTLKTTAEGAFDFGTFTDPELSVASDENYVVVGHLNGRAFGYGAPLGYSTNPEALEIVLGVPAQLKGTITSPDGTPVKNARVRKAGTPWIAGVTGATTDDTGQYVLEGMPTLEHPGLLRKAVAGAPRQFEMIPKSSQFLVVDHPDFGMVQPPYAECPATVDVSLDLPSKFSGSVVDGNGKPIAGVKVTARPSRNPAHREAASQSLRRGYSYDLSETDVDGKYSLELQYRGPLEIEFVGSNHLAKTVSDVIAESGETSTVPDVRAVAPAMVVGRIKDVDTGNTVACPPGVRVRVYAMGDGALRSVVVHPDGTYRLPVLPGTTFVYFSLASESLQELTKTWDVLDHPNPLTANDFPLEASSETPVEVNFPVRLNKEKLGKNLKDLQGVWEIYSGTYVAGGNSRLPLTADRLLDGDGRPLRFTIRGNQWIGHSQYFCSALEPEIGLSFCDGIAELTLDLDPSVQAMMLTRFESGKKCIHRCLYRLSGNDLELVCNASATDERLPRIFESPQEVFVLNARRLNDSDASPASLNGNSDKDQAEVHGTVTDSQGIAIPRAELRSKQSLKAPPLATTDELGRFSFRVPKAQKLQLLTIGPMCSPALQKLVVDRDLELNIQLQPSRGLNLKLVDAKGAPISGVNVSGDDWRDFAIIHQMTTDDEGRVKWTEAPNDSMEYLITKDGFSPRYNISFRADSAEQTVVLTRVIELQVRAQDDETSQPIHDFVAVPVLKSGVDVNTTCDRRSAIHTLNGTAQLKLHESQSQACLIRIEAKGYAVANCPVFEIENAPATVVVKLKRVDSLRGRIIDPDGNPALGSTVSFANPLHPFTLRKPNQNYSVVANEMGEFAFSHEDGDYTIVAQNDTGFAMKHCKAGNQPGTIQLETWAKIEGQISQGTSEIASHSVSLSDLALEKHGQTRIDLSRYVLSDQQGNFSIEQIPPSSYALQAVHSIFKSDELKSTESLPVEVKAGGGLTCKLGVTGASVRGNVQVSNEASRGRIAYRWSLNYLVSIEDPEREQSPEKLSSAEGSTFPSFNSAATWNTTEGVAYLRSFRHWQFELDDDGRYLIHGVPPGKYRMYVNLFDPPEDGCLAAPIAIKAIDVFVPQHQESIALSNIELEASSLLKVGDVVPNFEYLQLDGINARLNDVRGQVLLIQLWASWCGPCIAEFPEIREFVESAAGQRCVVLGLSVDDPDREIAGLLEKHKVDWPQGTLPSGLDSPVLRQLSVSSIPMHFVIGTDGTLAFAGRDFKDAKKAIASSLASEAKP